LKAAFLTLLPLEGRGVSDPFQSKARALNQPVKLIEPKVKLVAHRMGSSHGMRNQLIAEQ
jgi:hypothetical protein